MHRKMVSAAAAGALFAATLAPAPAMAHEYILVSGGHHFAFPGVGLVKVDVDDVGAFTVIAGSTVSVVSAIVLTGVVAVVPSTPIVVDVEEIEPGDYEVSVEGVGSAIIRVHEDGTLEVIQPLEGYRVVLIDDEFHLVAVDDPTVIHLGTLVKVIIIVDHHHHRHHDDDSSS